MIPKKLHFIWIAEGGVQMPEQYAPNIESWGSLNPGWEVLRWDGSSLRSFVEEHHPSFVPTWNALSRPVMKSDLARLLLLQTYGGLYLDADLKPFSHEPGVLERFLTSGVVYNKNMHSPVLPDLPSETYVDLSSAGTIMSVENCQIDAQGYGFANNMLMSYPQQDWMAEFCQKQKSAYRGMVLDFMGPWALTRFWRLRFREDWEKCRSELLLVPPHYFIWEQARMASEPPGYAISAHAGENTWGDKTKEKWWMV